MMSCSLSIAGLWSNWLDRRCLVKNQSHNLCILLETHNLQPSSTVRKFQFLRDGFDSRLEPIAFGIYTWWPLTRTAQAHFAVSLNYCCIFCTIQFVLKYFQLFIVYLFHCSLQRAKFEKMKNFPIFLVLLTGIVMFDWIWTNVFNILVRNKSFITWKLNFEAKLDQTFLNPPKSLGKFCIKTYVWASLHFPRTWKKQCLFLIITSCRSTSKWKISS